jgi:hypothetical protein
MKANTERGARRRFSLIIRVTDLDKLTPIRLYLLILLHLIDILELVVFGLDNCYSD